MELQLMLSQCSLSFSLSNSTVKEVLEQIENESEFVFVYYENTFDPSKKVSINANGKEVDEILDEVFAGQGVSYEINDRQVILKKEEATSTSSKAVHQQETKKIQGLVKDIFWRTYYWCFCCDKRHN